MTLRNWLCSANLTWNTVITPVRSQIFVKKPPLYSLHFIPSPLSLFRPLISAGWLAMVVDSSPRGPGPNERLLSSPCLSARVSAFQISVIIWQLRRQCAATVLCCHQHLNPQITLITMFVLFQLHSEGTFENDSIFYCQKKKVLLYCNWWLYNEWGLLERAKTCAGNH